MGDWVHQFASATGMVLDAGRRVLVYNGKDDYICNYLGGAGWTNVTQWKQQVSIYGITVLARSIRSPWIGHFQW